MTLLEILIALMVSAIGLLGMLALVGAVVKNSDFSRSTTEASLLGQTVLERLIAVPKANLAASCPGSATAVSFNNVPRAGVAYTYTCQIATCSTGLNCITVAVSWKDKNFPTRTHTVSQQRARPQ